MLHVRIGNMFVNVVVARALLKYIVVAASSAARAYADKSDAVAAGLQNFVPTAWRLIWSIPSISGPNAWSDC